MSDLRLVDPKKIKRNPENPRLIFRAEELSALEESIAQQGILVPLTLYEDGRYLVLLDGERRWRCAIKLGMATVPVIQQPKPDKIQNIMMMFAIHNARRDWDPLPTAYKLRELEDLFQKRHGRSPRERELAELASMRPGEVRRLRKLLSLPEQYHKELLAELEKPQSEQTLTVDHVLEATNAAAGLRKRGIVASAKEENKLRRAIIAKFRSKVINNTVAPRKLARLARAVERGEIPARTARREVQRLITEPRYSIDDVFNASVAEADFRHTLQQLAERLTAKLEEFRGKNYEPDEALRAALRSLLKASQRTLGA
jgi:ParB/RepB/Spo0J family partition protein